MNIHEFGPRDARKIVLIPGNMMCWRQFEQVVPLLEGDYHVVAVSTDGYDGTGETTFTTAEASAEKLEGYIRENLDGVADLIFGESFGSVTAGMLFHRRRVAVRSLIMSGPQYMSLGLLTPLMRAIIPRNQHRLLYSVQMRRKLPLLLKLYTRSDDEALLAQFENVPPNVSFDTLGNCMDEALRLYDAIDAFEPDPAARVAVWRGTKEPSMKAALKKLRRAYPSLVVRSFEGWGHGEVIAHPDVMASEMRAWMEGLNI